MKNGNCDSREFAGASRSAPPAHDQEYASPGDAHTLTLTRRWPISSVGGARAKNPKRVANLVQSELLGRLKAQGWSWISRNFDGGSYDLGRSGQSGAISGKMLKDLYDFASIARRTSLPFMKPRASRAIAGHVFLEKLADEFDRRIEQLEQYRRARKP